VAEACGQGVSPVREAFATPANHRFPGDWTREDDPLWERFPFSLLEKVVVEAEREGCLMLIIAPEWPGTQYPWWTALCALCPRRWQIPQDRPFYLRGGTDLMLVPRWRAWAVLLDSRERSQAHMPPPPPSILLPELAPQGRRRPGVRTRAPNS